jgi:hypothetical protein
MRSTNKEKNSCGTIVPYLHLSMNSISNIFLPASIGSFSPFVCASFYDYQ